MIKPFEKGVSQPRRDLLLSLCLLELAFTSWCDGICSSPNSHRTRTASLSSVSSSYSFLRTPGSKPRAAPHLHFPHENEGLQQPAGVEDESNPAAGVCCQDRKGRQGAARQTLAEVPGQKVPSTVTAKWGWAMPSNGPALADPANWGWALHSLQKSLPTSIVLRFKNRRYPFSSCCGRKLIIRYR